MIDNQQHKKKTDNSLLWKYAGFATQLAVALALGVYLGIKADKWIGFKKPFLVWTLPLTIIAVLIYKVIKDTSPRK
ncbi:MAG: AtpZ/AtpI family protein [Ferruginibacter sp.]